MRSLVFTLAAFAAGRRRAQSQGVWPGGALPAAL